MDKPKVIIFNAPPKSGKDTGAEYMSRFLDSQILQFKRPLLEMVAKILHINIDLLMTMYDQIKDKENNILVSDILFTKQVECFYSLREFIIHISENVIKPIFGNDFFGKEAAKRVVYNKWNIFSDGGFSEELEALYGFVSFENIILIKIRKDGCTFKDDSRGWLNHCLAGKTYTITNNGTKEDFFKQLDVIIKEIQWMK